MARCRSRLGWVLLHHGHASSGILDVTDQIEDRHAGRRDDVPAPAPGQDPASQVGSDSATTTRQHGPGVSASQS